MVDTLFFSSGIARQEVRSVPDRGSGAGAVAPVASVASKVAPAYAAISSGDSPNPAGVTEALQQLTELVQNSQRTLEFSVDKASGDTVITVLDAATGDVIRQIPSAEMLDVARRIKAATGALVNETA